MCTKHVKHSFSTMSDIYWLKMVTACKCQETHCKAIQTRMESWCLRCSVSLWTSLWKQAEAFPFSFSHFSNSDTRSCFIFSIFKLSEPRVFSLVNFLSFFFPFHFSFYLRQPVISFIKLKINRKIGKGCNQSHLEAHNILNREMWSILAIITILGYRGHQTWTLPVWTFR